jgi:acyl-CoA thioesterase
MTVAGTERASEGAAADTAGGWTQQPCRYRARASWEGCLVAETGAAVRVEEADHEPLLCFPDADVRHDVLPDGPPLARLCAAAMPDRPTLAGLTCFDQERVQVELVDEVEGDDPRDVTIKRFPTWGDAADLVALLDLCREGPATFTSVARSDWRRPVVEGSQVLGQAIVAASRQAAGRRVVSAHLVFPRVADARLPLRFHLDEVSAGRTFTTLDVRVHQGERCCATGTLLLDETAPDVVRHHEPAPDTRGPYGSEPCDMAVTGRDVRIVDGAYTSDPGAPVGPPELDAWVRFREVPDEPALHAALLAQYTGHLSIAAALRPHAGIGQQDAHHGLSTAINAIHVSFHAPVRADRWMLYHHRSTFAGDGMTHSTCRVHDEVGDLLASFTVDAMVRSFTGPVPTDRPLL